MSFFRPTSKVSTNDAQIKELLTRAVERVYPSTEFLERRLKSGERLSLYLGIDPTGPTLHMGHLIPLLKLRQFQALGHRIILLIGDFTGMIGDPTNKSAARKQLSREEVLANARLYKEQAGRVIKFGGENLAELRRNSEWLGKLSFAEGLQLCSKMTYTQAIKRDMFQKRIAEGKDIFLHELLYPLLQGYDSVEMDVDGEVGGNDQTFNMLAGRDLAKKMKNTEKFVLATRLLTDGAGAKMGKTEGNMVAFSDTPSDGFGKVMSWPDSMILSGFELCTPVPLAEVEAMKRELEAGKNPKEIKLKLAEAIVALLHSEAEAKKARSSFDAAFTKGEPTDFIEINRALNPMGALIEKGVVASRTELRRLVVAGAVTNLDSNRKVGEDFAMSFPVGKYRIGKHRFIRIHGTDTE